MSCLFVCVAIFLVFFFFFSSRRRHTRWTGDWSSDVCSSDLVGSFLRPAALKDARAKREKGAIRLRDRALFALSPRVFQRRRTQEAADMIGAERRFGPLHGTRSEERRVGKACGVEWRRGVRMR